MLKGAIFDADGTLLDSMLIWRELGQRYLALHGIADKSGLADILYPMSLEESSVYLKQTYNLLDTPEKIAADTTAMLQDFYLNEVTLKPGSADYLHYLYKRNIPMIVATSSHRAYLQKAFERLRIRRYFRDILTCSDLGVSKREGGIYLSAARLIGTPPEYTAVFEDVLHGVLSAKNAGFITVAVEDSSAAQYKEDLYQTADYYIKDFTDPVLKIMEK